jgi:hypothetical protein
MFNEQTTFILGAGASWHYGYPTGEALVQSVIEKAELAQEFFEYSFRVNNDKLPQYILDGLETQDQQTLWKKAAEECNRLRAGLEQVNPLVIDYYLGWNSELQNIGRLLIAWVILDCEYLFQRQGRNRNREPYVPGKDNWCRFIIHQLAIHCKSSEDLLRNCVSFVTFNYDVSLERALSDGLNHIKMFDEEDVRKFLGGSRIVHIYGKVREGNTPAKWPLLGQKKLDQTSFTDRSAMKELFDVIYDASKGLRVIDPQDKGTNDDQLTIARTAIGTAKRVFILGYGFDEHNSERLNLRAHLGNSVAPGNRSVAFTNYQDIGQINKRASKLFYGHPRSMRANGYLLEDRYEKSVRNTYGALALDFDLAD